MTGNPTDTTTPPTGTDTIDPNTPTRPTSDHHATNTRDHDPESPGNPPEPPQTISAPPNLWPWSVALDDEDDPTEPDDDHEPGAYHGPGKHADDCGCADCLALLPAEWFAEYDRYLTGEAQHA